MSFDSNRSRIQTVAPQPVIPKSDDFGLPSGRRSQMKKWNLAIGLIGACILIAACSQSNKHFVKKPEEIRFKPNRVLFLSVYADKNFYPNLSKEALEIKNTVL
jgi:hypothetical protein